MHRVLLVDDDSAAAAVLANLLRVNGVDCRSAAAGADAVRTAREFIPHVAVIGLRPPYSSGMETLRQLRVHLPATECVLFTGAALDPMVQVIRLVAAECVPASALDDEVATKPHAVTRWAETIALFIDASEDAATLRDFAPAVGVSVGAFRNWCRTAGLSPRRSLCLARALRAVDRSERSPSTRPQNLLCIVDLRTLAKFMTESGGTKDRLPADVRDLLERQQFIGDEDAIVALQQALKVRDRRGDFFRGFARQQQRFRAEASGPQSLPRGERDPSVHGRQSKRDMRRDVREGEGR